VGGRDVLDDGQAEAGAAGGAVPGRVDPVEALEDAVELVGGDADALVDDRDLDGVLVGRRFVETSTVESSPGVGDGVRDQVATAAVTCSSLPKTSSPASPP
jgi:hypothetical protein